MIIGLTGGIGSGKTIAGKYFQDLGVDVIDADDIAKSVMEPEGKAYQEFIQTFGIKYLDHENKIDRKKLRNLIFEDKDAKASLESMIHPLVSQEIGAFIQSAKSPYQIVIVPLITETSSADFYDRILVIDCEVAKQLSRAAQRDAVEIDDIRKIVNKQAKREKRNSIADDIIENSGTLEDLQAQVKEQHKQYLKLIK